MNIRIWRPDADFQKVEKVTAIFCTWRK